jgi:outer membrane murein-binding lipoprotein Lpp
VSDQQDLAIQMTALREQMIAMARNLESIKESVGQIVHLDKTIAELSIHRETLQKELGAVWKRIDDDRESSRSVYEKLNDKVAIVRTDLDRQVNTISGAGRVAAQVFTAVQAGMIAAGLWVFTNVNQATTETRILNQRITQLEQRLKTQDKP